MSNAYWDAFFELHRDLPREGPGEDADVAWVAETLNLRPDARICDAACGPGADIPALRAAAPEGHIYAFDKVEQFVTQAQTNHGSEHTVIDVADMNDLTGEYDLIWCAGAMYFLGIANALTKWRAALAPDGAVAFSQVCWFTDTPSDAARAGWADYEDMTDEAGVHAQISAAGYHCVASRRLSDQAWENYYAPMDARIAALRPTATGMLQDVLDEGVAEASLWRRERASFGYLLCIVKPA